MFLKSKENYFLTIVIDLILVSIIVGTGWLLIGFYLEGEFLFTGYQDWIYHAWRAQTIDRYGGISSWDHIWSNGLNHWRAYQYIQHFFILGVVKAFHVSFTKAMLIVTVVIFIGMRVLIYWILRKLDIRPIFAFLATMISFAYSQQWIAISDYSIFISLIVAPIYIYLWINVFNEYSLEKHNLNMKFRIIAEGFLALVSGALWIVHPVLANVMGGLFFISIGFRAIRIGWLYFLKILFIYIIGMISFVLPYLSIDYRFSNPEFVTSDFMRNTVAGNFFGLSIFFILFIGIAWLIIIISAKKIPSWAKVILVYTTLYFLLIFLGQNGFIPLILMKLQISRAIPFLALLLVFVFAVVFNNIFDKSKPVSRSIVIVILLISVIALTESISISTIFTRQPIYTWDDPVSLYFNNKEIPSGSIYVKNVTAASYFSKEGLRFVTSLNEHLLPHPLSIRFSYFMRSEIAYTGISETQTQLINDYVTVLGIEYLVLPEASPLVKNLTQENQNNEKSQFDLVDIVFAQDSAFAILHNNQEINNAFLLNANSEELQWDKSIKEPTLQVNSYSQWDDVVSKIANKIRNKEIISLQLDFIDTNKLKVTIPDNINTEGKKILITQSYDNNWKIKGVSDIISPSKIRFITVDIEHDDIILLENNWPVWHWPLQIFSLIELVSLVFIVLIRPKIFFGKK